MIIQVQKNVISQMFAVEQSEFSELVLLSLLLGVVPFNCLIFNHYVENHMLLLVMDSGC